MELISYVTAVVTRNAYAESFPEHLDIPQSLAKRFWALYADGERRGRELGLNLSLGDDVLEVSKDTYEGQPTGITIPVEDGAVSFGDVHCHPSGSIGHVGGYSAHSAQDILAIDNHSRKPLFARFVVSGTRIYLMVFRSGHTTIDKSAIYKIRDACEEGTREFFDEHCPVDHDSRNKALANMKSSKESNAYMVQRSRETPGFGAEMQRLSIKCCRQIAHSGKFGFYAGDKAWGNSVALLDRFRLMRST